MSVHWPFRPVSVRRCPRRRPFLSFLAWHCAIAGLAWGQATAPAITAHPPANFSIPGGGSGSISVAATGTAPLAYQWQATNPIGQFGNIANGGIYSGATSATLTITNPSELLSTTMYRCVVSNSAGSATSNAATLRVITAPPVFTQHPPSQTTATAGQTITLTAAASGIPTPTLQWEVSQGGGPFGPLSNGGNYSGVSTGSLTISGITSGMNGYAYRCSAYNGVGFPLTIYSSSSTLVVSVPVAPTITVQPPANFSIVSGGSGSISITATGTAPLSYQWQVQGIAGGYSNLSNGGNYSGVTTPTLTLSNVGQFLTTSIYRCVVTNSGGTTPSQGAMLNVLFAAPTFTLHPPSQTSATVGQTVTISAAATGLPAPTLQWERASPGSGYFPLSNGGPYSGVTSGTLTITGVTQAMNGDSFRCVASNSGVPVFSTPSTLAVTSSLIRPAITVQPPANLALPPGGSGSISVTATGSAPLTYQWQISNPVGFSNLSNGGVYSGVNTPTLTLTGVSQFMTTTQYQCVVSNGAGTETSSRTTLMVQAAAPTFTTQPPPQVVAVVGQSTTLTAAATGLPAPTLQWERSVQGGPFQPLTNGGNFNGVATGTLSILGITDAMRGDAFRCVAANGIGLPVTSNASVLVVGSLTITAQPLDRTVTVGQAATFSVATAATGVAFQWQRKPAGGAAWSDLAVGGSYSGVTTATLTVSGTTLAMNRDEFRCVLRRASETTASAAAILTVSAVPVPLFTQQPVSASGVPGQSVTFSVTVSGDPAPALAWQVSSDGGVTWQPLSGATASALTIASLALTDHGRQYRVIATNSLGGTAASNVATLTVGAQPTAITVQPVGGTFTVGQSTTLAVTATGAGTIQFQWFRNGVALVGATSSALPVSNIQERDAGVYHAEAAAAGGRAASQGALLLVQSPPRFLSNPVSLTVESGITASFTSIVGGTPVPALQWYGRAPGGVLAPLEEGPRYTGTRQATLRIAAVDVTLNGFQFLLRATNAAGGVDSAAATLRVEAPAAALKIIRQPVSQSITAGSPATFLVEAEGSGTLGYQWRKDGSAIEGATQASFSKTAVAASDAGGYSVVIRDGGGGIVTSNTAALTVVGAVDDRFDPQGGPNGSVDFIIRLIDGSLLAAGNFTRYAGIPRAGLVKLKADGSVEPSFDPGTGANGAVQALLEGAGGSILVVGQFDRFDGAVVPGVVRLTSTGARDPAFAAVLPPPPPGDPVPVLERFHFRAIRLAGGRLLLGGRAGVVALDSSGATIAGSTLPANAAVRALVEQFNGGVVIGGEFTAFAGAAGFPRLARLTPDLRLDPAFDVGTGPNGTVESLLRSPDGWIYVLGSFTSFNGRPRPAGVARISPTGRLDETYNPSLSALPLAAGRPGQPGEPPRAANGRFEANLGITKPNTALNLKSRSPDTGAERIVSIEPSGAVSESFDVNVGGSVHSLAASSDDDLVIGGDFNSIAGTSRPNIGVVTGDSGASRIVNLSARGRVSPGEGNLILGFAINGAESMRVLIRGVGPTLRNLGVGDALPRLALTIYDSRNRIVAENRSWRATDPDRLAGAMQQVGAFALTSADDTALLLNLPPGSYTATIAPQGEGQGVALAELYALDHGESRLVNLSVRGAVGRGDDVLIPAFYVSGGARLLLMRAVGPGLAALGVSGVLSRPAMELRRDGTVVAANAGWTNGFDPAAVQARTPLVGAFPLQAQSADSALLLPVSAGGYTVTASGADGGTGVALVEIYDANLPDRPDIR